jgi:hypothetical protein
MATVKDSTMYVEIPYFPRTQQLEMHEAMENKRWGVVVAHRRWGKTVAAVNHLIKKATQCTKQRPRFSYLAPLYSQAKTVAWDYLLHYTSEFPRKVNQSELWVELEHNGARIRLFGADNPDSLRGQYNDGVVIDEPPQMKPEVWGEIIRPTLVDRKGWAIFIGTVNGKDLLYDIVQTALRDPDDWFYCNHKASETGVIPEEEMIAARKQMSAAQWAREMENDFEAGAQTSYIPTSVVGIAMARHLRPQDYSGIPVVIGLDVARTRDNSVFCVRQGPMCHKFIKFNDLTLPHLVDCAVGIVQEWKPTLFVVDAVGLGLGVYEQLVALGIKGMQAFLGGENAVNQKAYANRRAEVWARMHEWLLNSGCIPDDKDLERELSSLSFDFTKKQQLIIESKKLFAGPSPDMADALSFTFSMPSLTAIARHEQNGHLFTNSRYNVLKTANAF